MTVHDVDHEAVQAQREQAVTEEVVASFATSRSPRFEEVMTSLVRHLHGFAREVRLTEREWETAIRFLTDTGQLCSDKRQEFILLSDVLGLSMMTVGINSADDTRATESTVFGPFFVEGSPAIEPGGDIADGLSGTPAYVHGTVTDPEGNPIPDALIEVWEADDDGLYDVQYEGAGLQGRGHLRSGADGSYDFWSVRPSAYAIPDDGPVGVLLDAAGRSPMRPAHIHFMVTAPGYRTLITHIFVADGEHLASDTVFGVKESLVVAFDERPAGEGPRGRMLETDWVEARFDIVLAVGAED